MRVSPDKSAATFAELCMDAAVLNPREFRQPSERPGRSNQTLVHGAMVAAGMCEPDRGARSRRGAKRRRTRDWARRALAAMRAACPHTDGVPPRYWGAGQRRAHERRVADGLESPVDMEMPHILGALARV